jgi:hypothetical protein
VKLPKDLEAKVLALAGEKPAKSRRKVREVATPGRGSWSITLKPACRVVTEANTHEHWATGLRRGKKQRRALDDVVTRLVAREFSLWIVPCVVTLTHVGPRMDDDNLARAFKALRDRLAHWLNVDDGDPVVTWRYEQRPGKPGVEIRIEGGA